MSKNFVNLKTLDIEESLFSMMGNIQFEEDINTLLSMPVSEVRAEFLRKFRDLDFDDCKDLPLNININFNYDETITDEDFEILVSFLADLIINVLGSDIKRDRERRLGIPKTLQGVQCSSIPLLRLINNVSRVDIFNIHITCENSEGGYRYDLV